jgi:hypothetical protein
LDLGCGARDLLDVVHGGNGLLGILLLEVAHEAEATAPAGVAVLDDDLGGMVRLGCLASASGDRVLTASSTAPNSSNFWRRVASSVCQARPLDWSAMRFASGRLTRGHTR